MALVANCCLNMLKLARRKHLRAAQSGTVRSANVSTTAFEDLPGERLLPTLYSMSDRLRKVSHRAHHSQSGSAPITSDFGHAAVMGQRRIAQNAVV